MTLVTGAMLAVAPIPSTLRHSSPHPPIRQLRPFRVPSKCELLRLRFPTCIIFDFFWRTLEVFVAYLCRHHVFDHDICSVASGSFMCINGLWRAQTLPDWVDSRRNQLRQQTHGKSQEANAPLPPIVLVPRLLM